MGFTDPHLLGSIFSGLSPSAFASAIAKALLSGFFRSLLTWVANGAASLVGVLVGALSSSTAPVLTGRAFRSEFDLMALLSAAVALPLVAVGAIQAIIRQEPGGLLRSVLVRLPLALLFTGVSVELVALGLTATDQASSMVIGAAGDPTRSLLTGLVTELGQPAGFGLAAFGGFLLVLTAAIVAFLLWLELAVRSAAVAAASLFLPLALVGLAWPATAHWARRLGETLAALVLSKLVIAAVLALAAGLLVSSSGVAAVVEGVALLAIAAFSPFSLLKLVPAVEAGAIAHLEGLSRRPLRAAQHLAQSGGDGADFLARLGGPTARGSQGAAGPDGAGPGAGSGTGGSGGPGAGGLGAGSSDKWGPGRPPPEGSRGNGTIPPLDQDMALPVAGPGPNEASDATAHPVVGGSGPAGAASSSATAARPASTGLVMSVTSSAPGPPAAAGPAVVASASPSAGATARAAHGAAAASTGQTVPAPEGASPADAGPRPVLTASEQDHG